MRDSPGSDDQGQMTQSPDLNPVEIFWDELDCKVKVKQSTSAHHLLKTIQVCFCLLHDFTCSNRLVKVWLPSVMIYNV